MVKPVSLLALALIGTQTPPSGPPPIPPGPRVVTPVSTGPGGFTLLVSTPAVDGPYDFAGNQGPKLVTGPGSATAELMFLGKAEGGLQIAYKVMAFRDDAAGKIVPVVSADAVAQRVIAREGFAGRGQSFACPPFAVPHAEIACYRLSGTPEGSAGKRLAVTIVTVARDGGAKAYAFIGEARESDVARFDRDPGVAAHAADEASAPIFLTAKVE